MIKRYLCAALTLALSVVALGVVLASPARAAATPIVTPIVTPRATPRPTLSLTPAAVIAGETFHAQGRVPRGGGRDLVLQALVGTTWRVLGRSRSARSGAYSITAVAPRPALGRLQVRVAFAVRQEPLAAAARVVVPVSTVTVVPQALTLTVPPSAVENSAVPMRVLAQPVRPGRRVVVEELVDTAWVARAAVNVGRRGTGWVAVPAGPAVAPRLFRAVVRAAAGAASMVSLPRIVSVVAPPSVAPAVAPTAAATARPAATPSASSMASASPSVTVAVAPPAPRPVMRLVYAVPSDMTPDEGLPNAISHEMRVVSDWFSGQTGGRRPAVEQVNGGFPAQLVRLPDTRSALEAAGTDAPGAIERAVDRARPRAAGEKLLIYVPVTAVGGCGFTTPTAAIFPMPSCDITPEVSTPGFPWGGTYLTAHEIAHVLGAVPSCAPHSDGKGHVDDDPRDLLYSGAQPRSWLSLALDPGHDDYFATGRTSCPDIADSAYWAA